MRLYKGDKLDYYLLTLFPSAAFLVASLLNLIPKKVTIVGVVLLVLLVGASAQQLSKSRPSSGLRTSQEIGRYLSSMLPSSNARFVFHELQYVNVIAFILSEYAPISHDISSNYIVDVCGSGDARCEWNDQLSCSTSEIPDLRLYEYLERIHRGTGYQFIDKKNFPGVATIVVGKVATPAGLLVHPGIAKTAATGNDYLITSF
jgi:hypothetical protein